MKRILVCTIALALAGAHVVGDLFAAQGDKKSDYCICLIDELFDLGSYSYFEAEKRNDGDCDTTTCGDPDASAWLGNADWPQECGEDDSGESPPVSPFECMTNAKKAIRSNHGLRRPARSDYKPVLAPHLDANAVKLLTVDFIKVVPDDRDPFFAKVFVSLVKAHPNRPGRPDLITAFGVQVANVDKPLDKVRTVKGVRVEGQQNLYTATTGALNYSVVAVQRGVKKPMPTKSVKKK